MVESTVRLTKTGVGVGTPEYMSPEQGQGLTVDRRTDIYSLGVLLYEIVTGRRPFEADTPIAIVLKHVSAALPLPSEIVPDLPESIERIILKCMAKAPADRYQHMGELMRALEVAATELEAPPAVEEKPVKEVAPPVVEEAPKKELAPPVVKPVVLVEEKATLWRKVPM